MREYSIKEDDSETSRERRVFTKAGLYTLWKRGYRFVTCQARTIAPGIRKMTSLGKDVSARSLIYKYILT